MDSIDRRRLRENYVELVRNLDPEYVMDYLLQEYVLSEEECENIRSGPTRGQRMRLFLSILPKKSKDGLQKLLVAMRNAGYTELAELLESPLSAEPVSRQESQSPVSPTTIQLFEDETLMSLKERLEQQSEIVSSMQAEMATLQAELKRQSQSFEGNEKYKRTVTVLNELEKEKAEKQRVYDEMYERYLKDMTKDEEEPQSKQGSRSSTINAVRTNSFSLTGGIRQYAKVKCVLIGDGGTGKTSIIHYFMHKQKHDAYIPTIFDNRSIEVVRGNTSVTVNFWDTAGQDGYDKLRPLSYADSHIALLVFSVTSQTTLNNILAKWHPEFRHYCRKVPILLVGNKTDPMEDQKKLYEIRKEGERFVEAREADKAAEVLRSVNKKAFLCSAHNGDGIEQLLNCIVDVGLKNMLKQRRKKNPCACM